MMYAQAERQFTALAGAAPDCAMAYWGIAMALFHRLWPGEPATAEPDQGMAAIRTAIAPDPPAAREHAYIEAAAAYYRDWENSSHPQRVAAWAAAREQVYLANPGDIDAAALYALAILATAPKADKTFSRQEAAGALLEALYATRPGPRA